MLTVQISCRCVEFVRMDSSVLLTRVKCMVYRIPDGFNLIF
jgi:hypothetical protein